MWISNPGGALDNFGLQIPFSRNNIYEISVILKAANLYDVGGFKIASTGLKMRRLGLEELGQPLMLVYVELNYSNLGEIRKLLNIFLP